jgi:hypothetical protein|tara:strand:- start:286 stop:660 length:375 start_codon:yes stop_codon:yes gene_type:complete
MEPSRYRITPFIRGKHHSRNQIDTMTAVAHITKIAVRLKNNETLTIIHNCFPFNRYRKWSLSDNGCELVKVRKVWYSEFLWNDLFINVNHDPLSQGQGRNIVGYITAFKLPKRQYEKRSNQNAK